MSVFMLLRAGLKRQFVTIVGVLALVAVAMLSLALATALYFNANDYTSEQMDRLGYGDTTLWVSGSGGDIEDAAAQVANLSQVESVRVQSLIFSGYNLNSFHSDDEGQLIAYDAAAYPYSFLSGNLSEYAEIDAIKPGEIFVSPALLEAADAQVGDVINFNLGRTGEPYTLRVAGSFEDPFMGSSMIDMKAFLVSSTDYVTISDLLSQESSTNVLARTGAMLHVDQAESRTLTTIDFNRALNAEANLAKYVEFSYSRDTIREFSLLQQNLLAGFLALFAVAFVVVALIVLGHAVSSSIELERRDIAALKTVGCSSLILRLVQILQYASGAVIGIVVGITLAILASAAISQMFVASVGMLVPSGLRVEWLAAASIALLFTLTAVVTFKTCAIVFVSPVEALSSAGSRRLIHTPIGARALVFWLALRRITSAASRYLSVFAVAVLLVFFVSTVGRINAWVGPNGEGLMDAFSAADHDIGIQPLSPTDMQAIEQAIDNYDAIEGVYSVAMQPVRVGGAEYTANVIDTPDRFHILEGRTCSSPEEIVVTRTVATALRIGVNDSVNVAGENGLVSYRVSGIYQCANEMGANLGMSLEGYERIGNVRGYLWCYHYLLANGTHNEEIADELQQTYGGSAAVHTNSWSGLSGLVATVHILLVALWGIAALLVVISIALASSRLLVAERSDMAVLKSIGFTSHGLRTSFALRIGAVCVLGAACGLLLSGLFTDSLVTQLLRSFGVGAFSSPLGFADSIAPALGIAIVAMTFAYLFSHRIKQTHPIELFADFEE